MSGVISERGVISDFSSIYSSRTGAIHHDLPAYISDDAKPLYKPLTIHLAQSFLIGLPGLTLCSDRIFLVLTYLSDLISSRWEGTVILFSSSKGDGLSGKPIPLSCHFSHKDDEFYLF